MSESVQNMIDDIIKQNFTSANTTFNDLLQDKITDALEQERVKIAGQVYNGDEEEEEDEELLSDEEIEEIWDEEDEDEDDQIEEDDQDDEEDPQN